MRTRGKYFKKEIWFSYCSRHQEYNEDCNICNIGTWENVIHYKITSLIYKISPSIWRWLVNRK